MWAASDGSRSTTRDGRAVRVVEQVKTGKEQPPVGARVAIHYDRNDPTSITTDTSHTAATSPSGSWR